MSNYEWLEWLDVSGPFLAEPVLKDVFPQGLDDVDSLVRKEVRQAYAEWRDAKDERDPDLAKLHDAWVDLVLARLLELDEDGKGENLKRAGESLEKLKVSLTGHGVELVPDQVLFDDANDEQPLILIRVYPPGTPLDETVDQDGWAATPAERMVHLCRANETRLGLVTNGERWMLIDAPIGAVTSFASWYAGLWGSEQLALQSFVSLLRISRFLGVDASERLPALLDRSVEYQDEVTDALGEQVRRAVEVLIQALDRADQDRNRELLQDVAPRELYEAGLTVMMRLVFLLSAEERDLLLLGDERYETNYAVSTLRMQLRAESDDILERRQDAWSRLLAICRAVYGGIEHETLRMPALGGSLFDPDRFPFLEGRDKDSNWRQDPAKPLPIDNRTVLLLLESIQVFQGRTLSYRGLDIEQLGYVYEGLLDHTVKRAEDVTLELDATQQSKKPWVTLGELDAARLTGEGQVKGLLAERTGSSNTRVSNDLAREVNAEQADQLLTACGADGDLRDRVKPYFHLLRTDSWGLPLVYPKDAFMVTTGDDRRQTGSHYTPTSLTEAIVKETLEPVVYVGPAEGKPCEEWQLKTAEELLELKICDPAMGSGAFLVQVCRWLGERVVEAWAEAEKKGEAVTADGVVVDSIGSEEALSKDAEERSITARRLIAERCIYGVDINPLAVELAKLSIWLVTLAEGRPFGFLDHHLRSGDSLLGIHDIDQLRNLSVDPAKGQQQLFGQSISEVIDQATEIRAQIGNRNIRDIQDVVEMAYLDKEARNKVQTAEVIADAFVGELYATRGSPDIAAIAVAAEEAVGGNDEQKDALVKRSVNSLSKGLAAGNSIRAPFHWPLEFPEVFSGESGGFDAIVGNPPFLGNRLWKSSLGEGFQYQCKLILGASPGKIDLCIVFHRRALSLLRPMGSYGLIATSNISEGSAVKVGLDAIVANGSIFCANRNFRWPGSAAVVVSIIFFFKGPWKGGCILNGNKCSHISSRLEPEDPDAWSPKLLVDAPFAFEGVNNSKGLAFVLAEDDAWYRLLQDERDSLLRPYITGDDIARAALRKTNRWALDIADRDLDDIKLNWPIAYKFLIEVVKSTRTRSALKSYKGLYERWWQFWNHRAELMRRLRHQPKFIAFAKVTKYPVCILANSNWLYTNKVMLIEASREDLFSICLSSLFRGWLYAYSVRSLGADINTLSLSIKKSVSTYPLPKELVSPEGRKLALSFKELLIEWCERCDCGVTEALNAVNNSDVGDAAIVTLREIIRDIDVEVAKAYGWIDMQFDYDFRNQVGSADASGRRWGVAPEVALELQYRLLELNKEKFLAEQVNVDVVSTTNSLAHRRKNINEGQKGLFE